MIVLDNVINLEKKLVEEEKVQAIIRISLDYYFNKGDFADVTSDKEELLADKFMELSTYINPDLLNRFNNQESVDDFSSLSDKESLYIKFVCANGYVLSYGRENCDPEAFEKSYSILMDSRKILDDNLQLHVYLEHNKEFIGVVDKNSERNFYGSKYVDQKDKQDMKESIKVITNNSDIKQKLKTSLKPKNNHIKIIKNTDKER